MRFAFAFMLLTSAASAQQKTHLQGSNRMEMEVERRDGAHWKLVDPGLVFSNDDQIRFRFRTNFNGFLYVMNQGTSGDYTLLYPREDTGQLNRIEAGKDYLVPSSTQGSFRIAGPAGHDVVYWMIAPVDLKAGPLPRPPQRVERPSGVLRPRCDDAIFRARGECIDSSAGPRALDQKSALPENLSRVPKLSSRELIFIRENHSSVVSSPVPLKGPVIYEFRLAHK